MNETRLINVCTCLLLSHYDYLGLYQQEYFSTQLNTNNLLYYLAKYKRNTNNLFRQTLFCSLFVVILATVVIEVIVLRPC